MSVLRSSLCPRACSGRHVSRGAHDAPGLGGLRGRLAGLADARQPKVHNFDHAIAPHHDVLWLDIAVHDASPMCRLERHCALNADLDRLLHWQLARAEPFAQRDALDQLFGDKPCLVYLPDLVNRYDVRMVQGGGGFGLQAESSYPLGVIGKRRGQNLQCQLAVQPVVPCSVHVAHGAASDLREDSVRTERAPYSRCRWLGTELSDMTAKLIR
jgi:hypothetical protein